MTDAASLWPRHARLWSVLILAVEVLTGAGGGPVGTMVGNLRALSQHRR